MGMKSNTSSEKVVPNLKITIAPVDDKSSKVVALSLTYDTEENFKRIMRIPGYDTLSFKDQEALKKVILSTVPDSLLKKSKKFNGSTLNFTDTCKAGKLTPNTE